MSTLAHLLPESFVVRDTHLNIFINVNSLSEDLICVRDYNTSPTAPASRVPCYSLLIEEAEKSDIIATLTAAIAILEQLPDTGTLADIASAMGTTVESLAV